MDSTTPLFRAIFKGVVDGLLLLHVQEELAAYLGTVCALGGKKSNIVVATTGDRKTPGEL